jgi:hypothetical protein
VFGLRTEDRKQKEGGRQKERKRVCKRKMEYEGREKKRERERGDKERKSYPSEHFTSTTLKDMVQAKHSFVMSKYRLDFFQSPPANVHDS